MSMGKGAATKARHWELNAADYVETPKQAREAAKRIRLMEKSIYLGKERLRAVNLGDG